MFSFKSIKISLSLVNAISDKVLQKDFAKNFFYANVCQYCTDLKKPTVKRCSNCDGVYYCSREHQLEDLDNHKDFCHALKAVKKKLNKTDLFKDLPANNMAMKNYLMDLTELFLRRPLKNCEKQVFLFPRVCIICNESNPRLVKSCEFCPHANFCVKHLAKLNHQRICTFLTFCFYMDLFLTVFKTIPLKDFIHVFPRNVKNVDLPDNIEEFLKQYVRPDHGRLYFEAAEVQMHLSTIFYRPLTLIYALEKLDLVRCVQLQIHIMCKKRMEEINHNEWELLFHWFPKLKVLKIVLIGCSGLPSQVTIKLCHFCKIIKRSLKVETTNMLYKDYFNESERVPDIILAYDVDFMTSYTWLDSSLIISDMNTPIVLTAMTQADLLAAIQDCVENPNNFSKIIKNPFGCMRPQRSCQKIVYPSYYISIYGDNSPKISEVLLKDDLSDEEVLININKPNSHLIAELEERNSLLEQKFEIFRNEVEKLKYRNDRLEEFKIELKAFNDRFFNLEDRFHQTFGHD